MMVQLFLQVIHSSSGADEGTRLQAAVLLRKMISSNQKQEYIYDKCNDEVKAMLKTSLLQLWAAETNQLAPKIGDIIVQLTQNLSVQDGQGNYKSNWNELVPVIFQLSQSQHDKQRISAFHILGQLSTHLKEVLLSQSAEVMQLLARGFSDPNALVRAQVVRFVSCMVVEYDKPQWAPLVSTWPQILDALVFSCSNDEALQEILENLDDIAESQPGFYKDHIQTIVGKLIVDIVRNKNVDSQQRVTAFEIISSLVDKKPKMMQKIPNFATLVIQTCVMNMAEIEDDSDWATRMDDEEDDDEDNTISQAEILIDTFVSKLGIDFTQQALAQTIKDATQDANNWQACHAAMIAIRQTVEHVEDENVVAELSSLLVKFLQHPNMRVRFAALHGIGQTSTDQQPSYQNNCHSSVMPALCTAMNDGQPRVAAMALSSYVCFVEALDNTVLSEYVSSQNLISKMVEKLQTDHRGVQEEALTSIAAMAGVLEKEFAAYYDQILPIVRAFVQHKTGEKERRLRGKAFECMSLLGLAVGKDRFMPEVEVALTEMLKAEDPDDIQKEYIKEASERICRILKQDFAKFLPVLLDNLWKTLKPENLTTPAPDDALDSDDEELIDIPRNINGREMKVRIKTSLLEEIRNALELLSTFVEETGEAFAPHLAATAQHVLPFLEMDDSDHLSIILDSRRPAFEVWGHLVTCARKRNDTATIMQLLEQFVTKVFAVMKDAEECQDVYEMAEGLALCLKNCGEGVLNPQVIGMILPFVDKKLEECLVRMQEEKEMENDEEEEETPADDDEDYTESSCALSLVNVYGSIMQSSPELFMQVCKAQCESWLQKFLGSADVDHQELGLHLACDVLEHLKDHGVPLWPLFTSHIPKALSGTVTKVLIPAIYMINLFSRLPSFQNQPQTQQQGQQFFTQMCTVVQNGPPKKKQTKENIAFDNAVCALMNLLINMPAQCQNVDQAWQLVFKNLPLRADLHEAKKINKDLMERVQRGEPNVIGANQERLPKLLGILARVCTDEEQIEDDVKEQIEKFLKTVPMETLVQMKAGFSEREMKKIEKIITLA